MPVRAIKALGRGVTYHVPKAIKESYISNGDNTFEVMFKRHFDKDGSLLRSIADSTSLTINSIDHLLNKGFVLANHPLVLKYGILSGEFLEIAFISKVKDRKHEPIFPKREVVEIDNGIQESDG